MIEEVVKMDGAIQRANNRLLDITGDEDAQRAYLVRFRAMCDMTSIKNTAREKGFEEGRKETRKEILKLFEQGLSIEEIKKQLT